MSKKSKENKESFEQKMTTIENIVSLLEKEDTSLEESLALFEKGNGLIRECQAILQTAEQKITLQNHDDTTS